MLNIKESATTGWCPNVTQKRKKELEQLSDWGEVQQLVDSISLKIPTNHNRKHTILWIQFNVSIVWCPKNIVTFTENCKLNY